MKWLKQHWRGTLRVFSVGLLCVSAFCGYWWFYKLAPARRTLDPEWCAAHSERQYWREVQKSIHRGVWLHDHGFAVGQYGDRYWAEWIMAYVTPGTGMGCLGGDPCHSATAMRYITNQDVGEDADAWLEWWEKNKSKSQEEWMADGFRHHGFTVDVPPTVEHTPVLLAILGHSETDESVAIPKEMKYNAFRCLRDTGFEPVAFALATRPASIEVERGLREYAKMEQYWPAANGVGILSFGRQDDYWRDFPLSRMVMMPVQVAAYVIVFCPLLLGVGLIAWSLRKKKQTATSV
ncbi:MAG: hypothetical protein RBS80_12035 [Thermoguttaceae bacterium]|jgi:hypothetical protein|nr:hypothetical protein [Thermoguttaceae bacterium]